MYLETDIEWQKHERCRTCIYRTPDSSSYGCDYISLTGHSRSAQVKKKSELKPENCPFYTKGDKKPNTFWKDL